MMVYMTVILKGAVLVLELETTYNQGAFLFVVTQVNILEIITPALSNKVTVPSELYTKLNS